MTYSIIKGERITYDILSLTLKKEKTRANQTPP